MEGFPTATAKEFIKSVMDATTGAAYKTKLKFPQPNAGKPIPGDASSATNDMSRYGMWGGNGLGPLGL